MAVPSPMDFKRAALVQIIDDGTVYTLSDHNRSELNTDMNRHENSRRTARARRRRYWIADKETYSLSWTLLPAENNRTVDGNLGADGLRNMFKDAKGDVTLRLTNKDGSTTNFTAQLTGFTRDLVKRYEDYYYDCSLELEEV